MDNQGRLVGIVVAMMPGTQIGLAIPTRHLAEMLSGRLTGDFELKTTSVSKGTADIEASAHVIDPMGKIKSTALHVCRVDSFVGTPKPNASGEWEKLAGARKLDLLVKGASATGKFDIKTNMSDQAKYYVQGSFVGGDGKLLYTEPATFEINLKQAPSVAKGPPKKQTALVASINGSEPGGRSNAAPGSPEEAIRRRMETLREDTRKRMDELRKTVKKRKS